MSMHRMSAPWRGGLTAALLALTLPAVAGVYKWTDAEGQVHYTQSPPPSGVQGEELKAPPKVDSESAVEDLEAKQKGFDERLEDKAKTEAEAAKTADQAAEKARYCEQLRADLAGLQTAQRIFTGEGADRRRLGEDERQAKMKDIEAKLAKDCS
ncbi:MAG: hypothetical protein HONDAALG_00276 [Gammaproteobacteria bacterium]|nr:hypothetical protein [Gammaproteobacteria bacterium]